MMQNKRTIRITRELIRSNIQNNPTPKNTEEMMRKFKEYWIEELARGKG